ncbi:MAG TPA: flavodoxin domain-containing protein [Myxococcaceae bacterium]|nr:flavodoxin domain-containing protein [Myxococcaceae bacterium]
MRPFLVVYATGTGHTRHVAERVADRIRTLAHEVQIQDVRTEALPPLERYSAVILAASVHLGHHEREMVKFVRARRRELERLPTVFLSVSLTEVAAADVHRPDDERLEARRATRKVLDDFVLETGWRPDKAVSIAGALTDTAYGPLTRLLMRTLAHRTVPDEPTRQVVFTDWAALNGVVDSLVRVAVERSKGAPPVPPGEPALRNAVQALTCPGRWPSRPGGA